MTEFVRANVDLSKSRKEAEMQFTVRERFLIGELEKIATGRGGSTVETLEINRDIAAEALDRIGWPSVRHMQKCEPTQ